MTKPANMIVGRQELADVLGIHVTRLDQLVRQQAIPKQGRGKYGLAAAVQAYATYREGLSAPDDGSAAPELKLEQARYYRAKADEQEMKVRVQAGELLPADKVGDALRMVILAARSKLAAIPAKVAARSKDKLKTKALVEAEVRKALGALSEREIVRLVSRAVAA